MDFLTLEFAQTILSKAAQTDLTEKIIILAVCFWYVRKLYREHLGNLEKHLTRIEKGLGDVAHSVSDLGASLRAVESNHSTRIKALEDGHQEMKTQLKSI